MPVAERDELEVLSLTKRFGLIPQSERFDKRVATEDVDAYKVVEPGWVVYNPYVIWEGAIHSLRRPLRGIVSPVYPVWERTEEDDGYVDFLLRTPEMLAIYESLSAGAVNRRRSIKKPEFARINVAVPPLPEQRRIAKALAAVRRARDEHTAAAATAAELLGAVTAQLLTRGLRREQTIADEGGTRPASWTAATLGSCCSIVNGSISYQRFVGMDEAGDGQDAVRCMAIKVADLNLIGNESELVRANVMKQLPMVEAARLVPSGSVVFPKRGAAIATNKKRRTTMPTALDPNLIAVHPGSDVLPEFLFLWAQTLDLRRLTAPGPTPQLNKKDLSPVRIAFPADIKEQVEICEAARGIEAKVSYHLQTERRLSDLFDSLVHELTQGRVQLGPVSLEETAVPA